MPPGSWYSSDPGADRSWCHTVNSGGVCVSEERFVYLSKGREYKVSSAQADALRRLDQARDAILSGATESIAIVETTPLDEVFRYWYVSVSDEAQTRLLFRVAMLQRMLRRDLFRGRGNAPPANSSKMVH